MSSLIIRAGWLRRGYEKLFIHLSSGHINGLINLSSRKRAGQHLGMLLDTAWRLVISLASRRPGGIDKNLCQLVWSLTYAEMRGFLFYTSMRHDGIRNNDRYGDELFAEQYNWQLALQCV